MWQELNRRKAVIYTHPTSPACCGNLKNEVPAVMIEWATDTTRTVASLLFSGAAARYPDIRWIFSHGGGTMPFLLSRFVYQEATMKGKEKVLPKGLMYELKKFHYDTAQANSAPALAALLKWCLLRRSCSAPTIRSALRRKRSEASLRSASPPRISVRSSATTRCGCCRNSSGRLLPEEVRSSGSLS